MNTNHPTGTTGSTVRVRGTRVPASFLGRDRDVWVSAAISQPITFARAA